LGQAEGRGDEHVVLAVAARLELGVGFHVNLMALCL
jgi:hypothetical protein